MEYYIDIRKSETEPLMYVACECKTLSLWYSGTDLFKDENIKVVENQLLQYIKEHEEPVG